MPGSIFFSYLLSPREEKNIWMPLGSNHGPQRGKKCFINYAIASRALILLNFFQTRHRVFSLRRLSERNRNKRNLSGSLYPERPGRSGLRIGRERLLVDLRNEKSHLWVRKLQSSLLVGRTYKLSKS